MAILTETIHTAGFLVSEANGMYRSRDKGIVVGGAAPGLLPGTLLEKSGDDFVTYAGGTVAGILFEGVIGTAERTVVTRDAEVVGAHLTYQSGATDAEKATANAGLAALGIIVR